jgi:hypothetical protein
MEIQGWISKSLFVLACSFLSGCTTPSKLNVNGGTLTSAVHLSQGKRVGVLQFDKQDFVVFLLDISWNQVEESGGIHKVEWRWYKDEQLVSKSEANLIFKRTPLTLRDSRAAITLGHGKFKVESHIDNKLVAFSVFEISE